MAQRLTVLVDARNVLRSTWPNLEEAVVVEGACEWASEQGGEAVVVFDGDAPRVGERGACRVVGTGRAETADAWLIREAARLSAAGIRVWLVTSDGALRAEVGNNAERVIGGGAFARELQERGV